MFKLLSTIVLGISLLSAASIEIKYSGFTKWNGHHNYSLYKDGSMTE